MFEIPSKTIEILINSNCKVKELNLTEGLHNVAHFLLLFYFKKFHLPFSVT